MAFIKFYVKDNVSAQLDGAINNTQTSITIKNGQNLPADGATNSVWTITKFNTNGSINKQEKVLVTNKSGNTLTVTRGYDGTTATTFDNDDYIFINVTAKVLQDLQDEVTRLETAKANDSAVVKLTGNQTIAGEKIFSQILKTRGNFVQGDETSGTGIFLNFWTPSSTQKQIDSYTNGTGFRDLIFNGGVLKVASSGDLFFNSDNITGVWQSFTPTLSGDSGSGLTYYEQYGRYKKIGKTVFFESVVKVNNKGTMAGVIYFQKPFECVWYSFSRPLAGYVGTEGQPITSFKAFPSNYNATTLFFKTMGSGYYNPLTWADISTLETFNIAGVYETP